MKQNRSFFVIISLALAIAALAGSSLLVSRAQGQVLESPAAGETTLFTEPLTATIQLPRTGQRTCYNTQGAIIDCAGTGQDGDIQAGAAWPDPRFEITYCDASGPCGNQEMDCDSSPSTDIALDRLTGLVWTRDAYMLPISVTWSTAMDFATNLDLCGYDDWRMPNILELQSMQNPEFSPYTYPYPDWFYLQEQGFYNVDNYSEFYWSSTTSSAYPGYFFESRARFGGQIDLRPGEGGENSDGWQDTVWPVRAGQSGTPDPIYPANLWQTGQTVSVSPGDDGDLQMGVAWPEPRFTVVLSDCVVDNLTGLMWPRLMWQVDEYGYPADTLNWPQSLDRANNFTLCEYDDWRLPNDWEMLSLIDFSQAAPMLPAGHPFINPLSDADFISATTYPWWTDRAWGLDLGGSAGWWLFNENKDPEWYYSLPVRGGIIGEPLRPDLTIDYPYGHEGSFLTITGNFWGPNDTLHMTINGEAVGEPIQVSGKGDFTVTLETSGAGNGHYEVKVSTTAPGMAALSPQGTDVSATVGFVLDDDAPLHPYSGDGTEPVFTVPAGIAWLFTFLALIVR